MTLNIVLMKNYSPLGVNADSQQCRQHVRLGLPKDCWILRQGQGMPTHDGKKQAIVRIRMALESNPIQESAKVIA